MGRSIADTDQFFYRYLATSCLLSTVFCLVAAQQGARGRRRWFILAAAQALHVLIYLDAAATTTDTFSYALRAWFGNIASAASITLLLPALMSTRLNRGKPLRLLDTSLGVIFGTMLMFTLGAGARAGDGWHRVWTGILALTLLSVLAVVARFAQAVAEIRHFTDALSKMIWVDLLTTLLVNCVCLRWFPDAPNAVVAPLAALPSILLCYWSIQTAVPKPFNWFALDRIVIDSLQPSVLTLSSVVLALFAFHARPVVLGALVFLVVLLYAVRTQLFYSRLFQERHTLRTQTEHLLQLATRDPLTGIANRRWFEELLVERLQVSSAYPCSLMMVDTDRFKEINDSFGHPAGDAVLCLIADVLQRETDGHSLASVSRIGGDEFAVLLPATLEHQAQECAERIRECVEVLGPSRGYGATVSIGVATMALRGSRSDLLRAADEALYRAKAAGRNAVRI